MSFIEEWAAIRANAAAESQVRTSLAGMPQEYSENGVPIVPKSPGGPSGEGIKMTPGLLRKKATKTDQIRGNVKSADDDAIREIRQAAGGLKGFASGTGMHKFEDRWKKQVKYLDGLLEKGVALGLRQAANDLVVEDGKQGRSFRKNNDSQQNEKN